MADLTYGSNCVYLPFFSSYPIFVCLKLDLLFLLSGDPSFMAIKLTEKFIPILFISIVSIIRTSINGLPNVTGSCPFQFWTSVFILIHKLLG